MSGAMIVGELLREDVAVLEDVPEKRTKLGALPDDIALPALLVREVSQIERHTLKRGATVRTIDRVSVTVRAANYREATRVIESVKRACAGKFGVIGAFNSVSILTAGRGPDLNGPANSFEKSQDFRVSYDAPA